MVPFISENIYFWIFNSEIFFWAISVPCCTDFQEKRHKDLHCSGFSFHAHCLGPLWQSSGCTLGVAAFQLLSWSCTPSWLKIYWLRSAQQSGQACMSAIWEIAVLCLLCSVFLLWWANCLNMLSYCLNMAKERKSFLAHNIQAAITGFTGAWYANLDMNQMTLLGSWDPPINE